MFRRSLVLLAVVAAALSLAGLAAAAIVHIRVEGKTQTIFGATEPRVSGTNALDVLLSRLASAEFFAHVTHPRSAPTSTRSATTRRAARRLGLQGERHLAAGRRRPGAAERRRPGALVLRGIRRRPAGRPRSRFRARRTGCYRATGQDDAGKEKVPPGLVFHIGTKIVPAPAGHVCPKSPHGLVWASAPGAVRSNRLP